MDLSQPNVINQPVENQPERRQLPTYKTKVNTNADGQTEVVYHQTAVVTFDVEQIILNTGGWRTRSTKMRMNQVSEYFGLGIRVFQKAGEWFVDYKDNIQTFEDDSITIAR